MQLILCLIRDRHTGRFVIKDLPHVCNSVSERGMVSIGQNGGININNIDFVFNLLV